jgi:hypothetical protein
MMASVADAGEGNLCPTACCAAVRGGLLALLYAGGSVLRCAAGAVRCAAGSPL